MAIGAGGPGNQIREIVADGRSGATWTLVSRAIGFGRAAFLAAVLGPTFLGNLFQTVALLPSSIYALFGGPLLISILVPRLVAAMAAGDGPVRRQAVQSRANSFLGLICIIFLAVTVLALLLGGAVMWLTTLGVEDPAIRRRQIELGRQMLPFLMPQLLFLGVSAVGTAVQHARRRFALAAAGQAIENAAAMLVLALYLALYGAGAELGSASDAQIRLLAVGMTAAVGIQAVVQGYGAWRCGVSLFPSFRWAAGEVRETVSVIFASGRYTSLGTLVFLGAAIVAGSVPGGVAAYLIATNLTYLAIALGAAPLSAAQLPRLTQFHNDGDGAGFLATYRASLSMALFLALPAAAVMFAVPGALAAVVAFGEMASPHGSNLITIMVGSLALCVVSEAIMNLATSASYARGDTGTPARAMALRATVAFAGMSAASWTLNGEAMILALGGSLSLAMFVGGFYNHCQLMRQLPGKKHALRDRWPWSSLVSAAAAGLSAFAAADHLHDPSAGRLDRVIGAGLLLALAGLVYLATQLLLKSQELRLLLPLSRGPVMPRRS